MACLLSYSIQIPRGVASITKRATSPAQLLELFTGYFAAGDISSLVSMYEETATLVPQPGEAVSGKGAIREALMVFIELRGEFEMKHGYVFESGDTALLIGAWTLKNGVDAAGNDVSLSGVTSDVVRRQPDGSWLYVIDNPWGAAGL